MAPASESDNLRRQTLKFANEIENPLGVISEGQEFVWSEAASEEFNRFLTAVENRFINCPDAAKIQVVVQSYTDAQMLKPQLYKRVCIQLIGHADLFNQFEQLGFLNDGREETRREIEELRVQVKDDFMQEISKVMRDFWSATGKLKEILPGRLTHREIDFIMKACFSEFDLQTRFDIVLDLMTNPKNVSNRVLRCLEMLKNDFQQMRGFASGYFAQVLANPI